MISRSSTEAKYRSMIVACSEIIWIQQILQELNISPSIPPILWCDNFGATFLVANPVFLARTMYIEIKYHFIREKVANKSLMV
jgi:hypothetical protein